MNLLLLPGNSQKSGEWIEQVEKVLSPKFEKTFIHSYEHWLKGTPEIRLKREIEILTVKYKTDDPYVIFAKSAGTMLALMAMSEGVLKPQACLFAGIPLVMVRNQNLALIDWMKTVTVPITIAQHENDPYGSFEDVSNYINLAKNSKIKLVLLPGDTHDYLDLERLSYFAEDLK